MPLRHAAAAAALFALSLSLGGCNTKPKSSPSADASPHDAATPPVALGLPPPPDVAAPPADAEKTTDGLASKVLEKGTGAEHPGLNDSVKVNYSGWTTDGKMFDSSVAPLQKGKHAEPIMLSLNHVIPGWTEGLQLMVVGEKRRFWIPVVLAYGARPRPGAALRAAWHD